MRLGFEMGSSACPACAFSYEIDSFVWLLSAGAGSSPRRATYFLCFAKESRQRKATPSERVPALRSGQPAVLAAGGVRANSLRSDSARPLSAHRCAPRRARPGGSPGGPSLRSACHAGLRCARPGIAFALALALVLSHRGRRWKPGAVVLNTLLHSLSHRDSAGARAPCAERSEGPPSRPSAAKARLPSRAQRRPARTFPLPGRRGAQRAADEGRALSERSAAQRVRPDPAAREHRRAVRRSRTAPVGSPFFASFLWRSKERRSPAGARPGSRTPQETLSRTLGRPAHPSVSRKESIP